MASKITKPRHASDLPGRKRRSIEPQFYDPRPSKFQKLDVDGIIKLRQDLQEVNANIPFAKMLPEESTIPTVKTMVGTVAQGSTIQDYIPPPNLITPVLSSSPAGKENVNPVSSSTLLTTETSLDINGQELGLNNATTTPLSTVHSKSDISPLSPPPVGHAESHQTNSNINNEQQEQNKLSFFFKHQLSL